MSLLTYLCYCSLKHKWFDYLMTAYFVNLFRHHMCLIRRSPVSECFALGSLRGQCSSRTWRGGLGCDFRHAHRTVQKRIGLDSNACPRKHLKTTALLCFAFLFPSASPLFLLWINNRPWGYKCCFWTSWPQQTNQIMWNKATGCLSVIISTAFLRKCSCYDNWFSGFPFYLAGISNLHDVK